MDPETVELKFEPDAVKRAAGGGFAEETERRLRAEVELDDFFENGTIALHWVGPDGTILRANKRELQMLGYDRNEYVGRNIAEFHVSQEAIADILRRLNEGEPVDNYEAQLRCKDGSIRDVLISSSVLRENGDFIHTRCFTTDITDRRKVERTNQLLVGELQHRVKNTLATVQALATQTLHSANGEEKAAFLARLRALGAAHDVLTQDHWVRAAVADVVDRALEPFASARIARKGGFALLDASRALQLTMALHELATNAMKHGSLSTDAGRVDIAWTVAEEPDRSRLHLQWREEGGPAIGERSHKGFGSRLIENSFEHAHMDFRPEGLHCSIDVRLS